MSPLGRWNPSAALIGLFAISAVLTFVFDPVVSGAVYACALLFAVLAARLPVRDLARAQLAFAGFALGILLVNAMSRPGAEVAAAGPFRVTDTGLEVGAALALRTLALGTLSVAFVRAVDPVRLMVSLHLDLHLPARVTFAVLAGQRMLQQLPAEWASIRAAQSVRAPLDRRGRTRRGSLRAGSFGPGSFGPGSFGPGFLGPGAFGRAAFALLVSCIRRSARVSQSLESRGLGLEPRTVWRR